MRRLLCAVTLALFVAGCSSDKPPPATADRSATSTSSPPGEIVLSVKSFLVETSAPPAAGEQEAAQAGVLATLQSYLVNASLAPLRSGTAVGDISSLFTGRSAPRATSAPDRAALYDEGIPPVQSLRSEVADLALTGLVGPDGKVSVMAATFAVKLNGVTSDTPLVVQRNADFVLVPEDGAWKIDAYDVSASRTTPAGTTQTTAVNR
jgi:hypothetical protein